MKRLSEDQLESIAQRQRATRAKRRAQSTLGAFALNAALVVLAFVGGTIILDIDEYRQGVQVAYPLDSLPPMTESEAFGFDPTTE